MSHSVHIRALSKSPRLGMYEGRRHLVVPVVALVEGVIHASNADAPEYVPADVLAKSAPAWSGQPVMLNHPERDGHKISANDPLTLERASIGRVFGARFENGRLLMEAWIDLAKAADVPRAQALVDRLQAGQVVEVSVGAFVESEAKRGRWGSHDYRGIWKEVMPDHLALLPDGIKGACSVSMGCGAMRAASKGDKTMCETDCKCAPPPVSLADKIREARSLEAKFAQVKDSTDRHPGLLDTLKAKARDRAESLTK
jgi:hypothetical protein